MDPAHIMGMQMQRAMFAQPPIDPPVLFTITPDNASAAGGGSATLGGLSFGLPDRGATYVLFGTTQTDPNTTIVVDVNTVTCVIPPGIAGVTDVFIGDDSGQSGLIGGFTYT